MSHRVGEAIRDGKTIGYFEYNGTVEALFSLVLRATAQEVHDHWREDADDDWDDCTCGAEHVTVLLFDGHWFWPGSVCLSCMRIILGRTSAMGHDDHEDWSFGRPWAQTDDDRREEAEKAAWGPKCNWDWQAWWNEHKDDGGASTRR